MLLLLFCLFLMCILFSLFFSTKYILTARVLFEAQAAAAAS